MHILRYALGRTPRKFSGVPHGLQVVPAERLAECDAIFYLAQFRFCDIQKNISSEKPDTGDGIPYADFEEFEKQRPESRNGRENSFLLGKPLSRSLKTNNSNYSEKTYLY